MHAPSLPFLVAWLVCVQAISCVAQTKSQAKQFSALFNEPARLLQQTEVTNGEYRQFLTALRNAGRADEANRWAPDTAQWLSVTVSTAEPLKNYYFGHPGYDNYPVVNVTQEGARAFCQWLTEEYNALNEKGKGAYRKVIVRLPTEAEWQTAAWGLLNETAKNFQTTEPKRNLALPWNDYPYWNFPDAKGKFRANTKFESGLADVGAVYHPDGFLFTAPVKSYAPTDGGFYDLIGNAAEWVAEPGWTKGGSWNNTIDECFIEKRIAASGAAPTFGFRVLLEIVER